MRAIGVAMLRDETLDADFSSLMDRRREWTDVFQLTSQCVAIIVVLVYVSLRFAVRLPYSFYSVSLYNWWGLLAILVPLIPVFAHLRTHFSMRGARLLIGLSIVLFDLADLVRLLGAAHVIPHLTSTPRDVLLVASYLTISVAVVIVMQQSFGPRAISVRLDGIIAGLALAALASTYWFHANIEVSGRPLVAEINILNPILVIILLVLLIAGLIPRRLRLDSPTTCLIVGFVAMGVGDFMRLNGGLSNSPLVGTLINVSGPIAILCFAFATWTKTDSRDGFREILVPPRGLNLIPVFFGVLSIAILADSVHRTTTKSTIFMALGSLIMVIFRMVMTQGEVRHLGRSNFMDARTDHVTELSNRRAFLEDGEAKLAALRPDQQLAIVLIDLDGFKEVNDSLGHAHGDELLKIIGQRFARQIGERGSMARLGGDEFACTLIVESESDPMIPANELAKTLRDPVSIDGTKVRVSASIGVAIFPAHGVTHSALLRSADVAMYEAKRSRSAVRMYSGGIDKNSRERLTLINDLRTAIDRNRLTLHFQPTRHLLTGSVHGVEALVRWQHPTLGLLQPDEFIPIAEGAGLISPLTRTVLHLAITELARLDRNGHQLQMSVNISQWDLIDPQLPNAITRMLEWYHLPASRLVLEVTESSLVQDPGLAKRSLEHLRWAGVKISIDDFGVGYSSMSQLLDLPVDELKIDKSFVLALDTDARAISIIRAMIEMARALGLTVVAEGAETPQAFSLLSTAGVDVIQGQFVAHPLPSEVLDEFLRSEATFSSASLEISGLPTAEATPKVVADEGDPSHPIRS